MVRFFAKKEEKTQLTDAEVTELSNNAYELGYEVGYHRHSELGWVSERYSMLEDLAREAGLGEIVKGRYTRGKEDGLRSKERDMHSGLSKKGTEKQCDQAASDYDVFRSGRSERQMVSGYGFTQNDDHFAGMMLRPSLMNLPSSTSRTRVIDRPSQLQGFKPLYPKC